MQRGQSNQFGQGGPAITPAYLHLQNHGVAARRCQRILQSPHCTGFAGCHDGPPLQPVQHKVRVAGIEQWRLIAVRDPAYVRLVAMTGFWQTAGQRQAMLESTR